MQNVVWYDSLCLSVCLSVRACVCFCACALTVGWVQGGCCVQCPPKAKTCQVSMFPDGTSWRYSCKPLIMWSDSTQMSITPSVTWPTKSTNHCPPLLPSPAPSSAAHHVSPMWCFPSITYCCHNLPLHADRSGDKYSLSQDVLALKLWDTVCYITFHLGHHLQIKP